MREYHIAGDLKELMDAIQSAYKAQQRWLATPEGQKAYREWKAKYDAANKSDEMVRLQSTGIPRLIAESCIDGFDHHGKTLINSDVQQTIENSISNECFTLLVCGYVGTGKTTAACRWLSRFIGFGLYIRAADYCELSGKVRQDRPSVHRYMEIENLVLDEVGQEGSKDVGKIETLIHARHEDHLKTIVLANKTPDDFEKVYGDRIDRRIESGGKRIIAKEVLCPGEQQRQGRKHRGKQGEMFNRK